MKNTKTELKCKAYGLVCEVVESALNADCINNFCETHNLTEEGKYITQIISDIVKKLEVKA